jgi:hypothetical protein
MRQGIEELQDTQGLCPSRTRAFRDQAFAQRQRCIAKQAILGHTSPEMVKRYLYIAQTDIASERLGIVENPFQSARFGSVKSAVQILSPRQSKKHARLPTRGSLFYRSKVPPTGTSQISPPRQSKKHARLPTRGSLFL